MAHIIKDRVLETSTTTGTGNLTLAGAVTGFRAFSSVCATNDTLPYFIEGVDAGGTPTGEWETGIGTYSGANTLTRTTVLESSNSGSVVTLSAGTKRVGIGAIGRMLGWNLIETVNTTSGTTATSAAIPQTYQSLLLVCNGISHSNGSTTTLGLLISTDNSTYSTAVAIGVSTVNTVTWYGGTFIPRYFGDFGIAAGTAVNLTSSTSMGSASSFAWRCAGGIKYIRLAPGAGSFDAGSFSIYGQ